MMPTDDSETETRKDGLKVDINDLSKAHEKQVRSVGCYPRTEVQLGSLCLGKGNRG